MFLLFQGAKRLLNKGFTRGYRVHLWDASCTFVGGYRVHLWEGIVYVCGRVNYSVKKMIDFVHNTGILWANNL